MRRKAYLSTTALVGASLAILAIPSAVHAQQFFNDNVTAPNGAINGGSGPWDNATTNWTNATGTATAAYDPTAGTVTVFGASGVLIPATAGTVTVAAGGIQLTSTVQFRAVGDFLDLHDHSQQPDDGGRRDDVRRHRRFGQRRNRCDDRVGIPGANGVNKTGVGTLTLSAMNNYTGATSITGGTLALTGRHHLERHKQRHVLEQRRGDRHRQQ